VARCERMGEGAHDRIIRRRDVEPRECTGPLHGERRSTGRVRHVEETIECKPDAVEARTQVGCAAWDADPGRTQLIQTRSSSWPVWAAGLTRSSTCSMHPSPPITNVVRSIPRYFRPYSVFSFQTP